MEFYHEIPLYKMVFYHEIPLYKMVFYHEIPLLTRVAGGKMGGRWSARPGVAATSHAASSLPKNDTGRNTGMCHGLW
jgi:hypothetical protein